MRRVRNVATLPELDNLPLTFFFSDHSEGGVGIVQIKLCPCLIPTSPTDHVHETPLIAVRIGNAERIDEAMLEWCESDCQSGVERIVKCP